MYFVILRWEGVKATNGMNQTIAFLDNPFANKTNSYHGNFYYPVCELGMVHLPDFHQPTNQLSN